MFNNFCKGRVVIILGFSLFISASLGAMEDDGSVPKPLVLGNNVPQINYSNTHNSQGVVVNRFNDQQRNYNHLHSPLGMQLLNQIEKENDELIQETEAEFKVLNLRINELESKNEKNELTLQVLLREFEKLDSVLEKTELLAGLIKDIHTGTYRHFQEFFDDVKSEKMLITPADSDEEDDDFEVFSNQLQKSYRIVTACKTVCCLLKKSVRNPVDTVFGVVDICMYRHPLRTLSVVAATVGYAGAHIGLILLKEHLEGDLG